MKKQLLLLLAFVFSLQLAKAQDPHYSQFYYSPFIVNPALTGNIEGNWRVGLNYKNQWGSISAPSVYSTPSVWGDVRLYNGRFTGNSFGIGGIVLADRAGDGNLTTTSAMLSAAYHQALDNSGNFHLSAGGNLGWCQKSIDLARLDFYDEFTGTGFQEGFASADPIFNSAFSYFDVGGGIAFSGLLTDYSRINLGASLHHVSKPTESFYVVERSNQLGIRYAVHGTATIGVKNKMYIFPSALYQLQTSAQELVAGVNFGYNFSVSRYRVGTIVYAGSAIRANDAVIPTIGMMTQGLKVGLSYDVNISDLQAASSGQGGFEVAVVYTGGTPPKKGKRNYCPRF
jgi:type IX secretion system PorP/SprF family membrane protein